MTEDQIERLRIERDAAKEEALRLFAENRNFRRQDDEVADLRRHRDDLRRMIGRLLDELSPFARTRLGDDFLRLATYEAETPTAQP